MEYICDGEEAAFVAIVSWLAHLVQQPAEKLNFGILLQGMQGTGKSFISQIMNKVLGVQNCTSSTTTQQMMGQFTDWMEGKQLVTIEEIRDQEERFKVYNHLKGLITNDVVKINIKGIPAYDVPNRTNFICYTNYEDAVPMDDDDRRFIIHFSRALPKPRAVHR
jgi:phage/plasmid-associated DNA primase